MAVSYGSVASISLPCTNRRSYYGVEAASANVLNLKRKTHKLGIGFLSEKRLHAGDSLRVSCHSDHKTSLVTGKSWERLVIDSKSPVLVEFYTGWCGPCRMVHRLIDEIATEYSGRLNCLVVDADRDSQLADHYDVKAVPMVLLFKDGEKRESILGTMPKNFYISAIERILASP